MLRAFSEDNHILIDNFTNTKKPHLYEEIAKLVNQNQDAEK